MKGRRKIFAGGKRIKPVWLLLMVMGFLSGLRLSVAKNPEYSGLLPLKAVSLMQSGALKENAFRSLLPDSLPLSQALDTLDAVQKFLHAGLGYHRSDISRHEWKRGPDGVVTGLELWIEKGVRTSLGSLRLRGVGPREEDKLIGLCGLSPGLAVTDRTVGKALEQMARFYADRGYPFCSARLSAVDWEREDRLALTFELEQGRFVRLGRISVEGAKETKISVIKRITGLQEEDPYSEKLVTGARDRILRSGLFTGAQEPVVTSTNNPYRVDLTLRVTERPSTRFEGALGTGGQGSASGLSGFLRLGFDNLFGTARSAQVLWQRPRKDWLSLRIAYSDPWLVELPLSLDAAYSQEVRDSLYTSTGGYLELGSNLTDRLKVGLGASYSKASPGSETYQAAENSTCWAVSGVIGWSNILHPANPIEGLEFKGQASAGKRRIDTGSARELSARVKFASYLRVFSVSHVFALSGGFGLVSRGRSTPQELPYHARIPIGGAQYGGDGPMVRGQAEEAYRGRRVGWINLEYRYVVGTNNRLFAFYDFGAVQIPAPALLIGKGESVSTWHTLRLQGYGAGLQLESRLGLINLAVAFSPERGLGNGRLHLQLIETF
ncbi:MAG TPA: POTRA domain-containing protein [archaeon]|nr:POTRA domain-containing protein [archaeon]